MPEVRPTLHMLCGKAAAGKSTLTSGLASHGTIVIAQDHWMSPLYPNELRSVEDYLRYVPRLRDAIGPHVVDLLRTDLSVVLDWPANTVATRAWMRTLFEAAGASHRLHYLDVPDAVCLERLAWRNASGRHQYHVSPAQFAQLTRLFEPGKQEGFEITTYRPHD